MYIYNVHIKCNTHTQKHVRCVVSVFVVQFAHVAASDFFFVAKTQLYAQYSNRMRFELKSTKSKQHFTKTRKHVRHTGAPILILRNSMQNRKSSIILLIGLLPRALNIFECTRMLCTDQTTNFHRWSADIDLSFAMQTITTDWKFVVRQTETDSKEKVREREGWAGR